MMNFKKLGCVAVATAMMMTAMPFTAFANEPDTLPHAPNVTIDTTGSALDGHITIVPGVDDETFDEYNIDTGILTETGKEAFKWEYAARGTMGLSGLSEITVKVSDANLTEEETEEYKSKALHTQYPVKADEYMYPLDIEILADGEPVDYFYGGLKLTVKDLNIPNSIEGHTVQLSYGEPYSYNYDDGVYSWEAWGSDDLRPVVMAGPIAETCITPIDTIEINGATLSFSAGDKLVFTGKPGSDLYRFHTGWAEYWEDEDGHSAYSTDSEVGIHEINTDTTYKYSVAVELTDDAYYNKGYYFTNDVKLVMDGSEMSAENVYVTDDDYNGLGHCADFYNVHSFRLAGKQDAGKQEVKPQEVKPQTVTPTPQKVTATKQASKLTVKAKKVKANAAKKTKIKKTKAFKISGAAGKVTFKKVKGNKKISVSKAGKITVKKGLKKGKTYKVKVKVSDAGTDTVQSGSKTVTLKVKIK